MSQDKGAGVEKSQKPEEADKRCSCPGDAAGRGPAAKRPTPGTGKEGFLIRLLPSTGHDLSSTPLRPPPAPRRASPRPMASAPLPAMLLVSQQPVGVMPPFPGVAPASFVASPTYVPLTPGCVPLPVTAVASAAHGSDAACRTCCCKTSHRHCCSGGSASDYGALSTFNIPPYAMPFFGEVYRNAARASEPPAGGGNVNVVTKVASSDRRRKKRAKKKQRDSSSDSSDSYSKKRRKSEPRKVEPPPPITPPVPERAPTPAKQSEAPEMNPAIPVSPLMYPPAEEGPQAAEGLQATEGQQAADENLISKPEEQDNAEEGPSKLACILVILVVGVCIVIAIVLALYPSILFGSKDEGAHKLQEAHALLHRAATELDLFKELGAGHNSAVHGRATSRTSEKSAATGNGEEQWTDRI